MLKYVLQEMPDMHNGQQRIYPKILIYNQIGNEKIVERFQDYGMMPGPVNGVLKTLPDILRRYLTEGHTVKVDGLGTFSLSLEFEDDKPSEITEEGTEEDYRHVRVKSINFRPDVAFMQSIQQEADCVREETSVRRAMKAKYTPQERLQRALDHLKTNSSITLNEYANMNCLSRTAASQELKRLAEDPASGINASGAAPHKVWVKSE